MAVRGRYLAGQQVLDRQNETVGDGSLRNAGIVQAEHPTLGTTMRAEELAALTKQRLDVAPAPVARLGRGGLWRDEGPRPRSRSVEPRRSQPRAVLLHLLDRPRRLNRHSLLHL